jgi:hypothetical protein
MYDDDLACSVRTVATLEELGVDDRVLAGAHVLREPAELQECVAQV